MKFPGSLDGWGPLIALGAAGIVAGGAGWIYHLHDVRVTRATAAPLVGSSPWCSVSSGDAPAAGRRQLRCAFVSEADCRRNVAPGDDPDRLGGEGVCVRNPRRAAGG